VWSVPAEGGPPKQLTVVSESQGETFHNWPDPLPDDSVLYTALGPSGHAQDARLVVEDVANHRRTIVAEGVTYGRYLASGHLIYANASGTLLLQPFDLRGKRTTGPARAVLAGVRTGAMAGAVAYAVSSTGTLVYVGGTELEPAFLTEVDRAGRERRRFGAPRYFDFLALSPNGRTLAMTIRSANNDDIYLMDVESGRFDRFSFTPAEDESPVWSPDGTRIAYSSAWTGEQRRILIKTVGSTEPDRLLYTGKRHLHLGGSWSPDGRWLTFYEFAPRSIDVWLVSVETPPQLVPIATTVANEIGAIFSRDGRWLAYVSDETGRLELYVVSFPDLAGKQMVSREGAGYPQWSPTSREVFFWDRVVGVGSGPGRSVRMMMSHRDAHAGAAWQNPVALFEAPSFSFSFAQALDGRSFYVVKANPNAAAREIFVVVNWLQDLLSRGAGPHP
jgi:hypothetical protein